MSRDAVIVRQLSKRYALDARPRDRLRQVLLPGSFEPRRELWALRDLSFRVSRGETLGIMGRNGCGKSTLLEVIAGTLSPTSGSVSVEGRVAALLELGAGFDPELSGRENVAIYGALLGMSRTETAARFDDIVEFAGLESFIDEPVRTYSTGMFVRLAFSVAVSSVPDVLLIDEALAVGDEAFQRRCFGRLAELKEQGVTLLFVSHSASTVLEICDRAVLLDAGEMLMMGEPKEVVERYHRLIFAPPEKQPSIREEIRCHAQGDRAKSGGLGVGQVESDPEVGPDAVALATDVHSIEDERFDAELRSESRVEYVSHGARISDVQIRNAAGEPRNVLRRGALYWYEFRVDFEKAVAGVRFGMMFKTVSGVELGGIMTHPVGESVAVVEAGRAMQIRIPFRAALAPGTYFANAGVVGIQEGSEIFLHRITDALRLRIAMETDSLVSGAIDLSADAATEIREL